VVLDIKGHKRTLKDNGGVNGDNYLKTQREWRGFWAGLVNAKPPPNWKGPYTMKTKKNSAVLGD